MSIVIKKIGSREYAYEAYRHGSKVIHKYLGPALGVDAQSKIFRLRSEKILPEKYRIFFWDADPNQIRVKTHSRYIIERVLELGDMDAFLWLQKVYNGGTIVSVLEESRKISPKSKNFWRLWYGIENAR